jgi:hypothetical protein
MKTEEIEKRVATNLQKAQEMKIVTAAEYTFACEFLKGMRTLREEIKNDFAPQIEAAKKTLKITQERWKRHDSPLAEADELICDKISAYDERKERQRREEEERLNRIAREEARRKQEAEAARIRKEAAEKAERDRIVAEERAAKLRAEGEQRAAAEALRRAEERATEEKRRAAEQAKKVAAKSVEVEHVTVESRTPQVEGVSHRDYWKFRIVDESKIPDKYWKLDTVKIGEDIRTAKRVDAIPGVEGYVERGTAITLGSEN